MAATYSGNPADSAKDLLRFTLGDTDMDVPLLLDAEYEYLISLYPTNITAQTAAAFRAAATSIGIRAKKRSLGPQSEDDSNRLDYFIAMADKYDRYTQFGIVPPLPDYNSEKVFEKGMMSNDV